MRIDRPSGSSALLAGSFSGSFTGSLRGEVEGLSGSLQIIHTRIDDISGSILEIDGNLSEVDQDIEKLNSTVSILPQSMSTQISGAIKVFSASVDSTYSTKEEVSELVISGSAPEPISNQDIADLINKSFI